jgi:putative phosphoesterase
MAAVSVPTRVVIVADTHLVDHDPRRRDLPAAAWARIRRADTILHAGDVLEAGTLDRLGGVAPTYAVLGNNDATLVDVLPETQLLDLAGVRVAMVHDSGPSAGRAVRMRRLFPDADVVVFGHSHIPCNEVGMDGQILFNPGSPTTRRSQPTCTMGELILSEGRILERRIIDLGP